MPKTCRQCAAPFEVTDVDRAFYDKVSPVFGGVKYAIPEPTLCPECRSQRRLTFRNERSLYKRKCDASGKEVISMYPPTAPYTIYDHHIWWSDSWDSKAYGQDFDFNKPFFEQFQELRKKVPRPNLNVVSNENCDFVNQCGYSKNCYLSYNTDYSEDCFYSENGLRSKNCVDTLHIETCELCYECISCSNCYQSKFLENCKNCSDSAFLKDCIGCRNCFGSANLRNKEYYFFNQPYSKEEYEQKLKTLSFGSFSALQKMRHDFQEYAKQFPHEFCHILSSENVSGDSLRNCKNAHSCFDCFDSEDIDYCTIFSRGKDCYDYDTGGYEAELCYEMVSAGDKQFQCAFNANVWSNVSYMFYCDIALGCSHCFGCTSLRQSKYCILNKQYTKEEYEALVPKIIEHMRKTGEWGEFFPSSISPFGYNETVANEYFPLTREETLKKGFKWSDYEAPKPQAAKVISAELMKKLPDLIDQIPDDVLNWALTCEVSGKLFKIQPAELAFYRKMKLPIPRRHPDIRHADRMALRNPRKLWKRQCAQCNAEIETTYSPERPEKVLCESCYLKAVI